MQALDIDFFNCFSFIALCGIIFGEKMTKEYSNKDKTECKLPRELEQREKQLNDLLAKINAIILEGDAEKITYIGGNVEQILGYPVEQWFSFPGGAIKFWVEHLHPEDRDWAAEYCAKAIGEGKNHSFEYRMMSREGKVVWIHDAVSVEVQDGVPVQVRSVLIDITERKRMEETLQESENKYRALVEQSLVGIYLVNEEGFIYQNEAGANMFGYRPEEIVGRMKPLDLISPHDRPLVLENIKKRIRGEVEYIRYTFRGLKKDGSEIECEVYGKQFLYKGKSTILGMCIDITDQKILEKELRENEIRYRSLFEDSPISLWEEDFTDVKIYIDGLRDGGVKNFREYFEHHPEAVAHCAAMVRIVDVNKATLQLYKAKGKKELLSGLNRIFAEESYVVFKEALIAICEGKTVFERDAVNQTLPGEKIHISIRWCVAPGFEHTWGKILISIIDISERNRAVKELQESQSQLQAFFNNAVIGIAIADPNGHFIQVNKHYLEMFGYDDESELFKKTVGQVTYPEDRPSTRKAQQDLASKKVDFIRLEKRYVRKDGSVFWGDVSVSPIHSPVGKIEAFVATINDITGKKEVEIALRESEHRYRLLIESANEGIGVVQDSKFCFVNPKLSEISGYTKKEIMSRKATNFAFSDDREMLESRLRRRLKGEDVETNYPFRIIAKDKSIKWLRANSVRIEWEGRPAILNFFRDVTEHIQMEEKIQAAAQEWNTTFDAINDLILILDTDGIILRSNKAQKKFLEKSFNEIIGRHCYDVMNCKLKATETCPFKRMVKTLQREIEIFSMDESWSEVTVDPIFDKSGKLIGAVHIMSDITERKRAEEQIRQQNELLNNVMKSLTHPFYVVDVHDYKIVMANPVVKQDITPGYSTCYQFTHNRKKPCTGLQHPCPIQEVTKYKKPTRVEHVHTDKKGNKRNYEIHAYPIFDDKGEVTQIIEYTIDITERRKAEEMTKLQQEQLIQADKMVSLGILVSGVAHEINNPNNSIALNTQFLEKAWQSIYPILDEYYCENKSFQIGGIKYDKFREKIPFLFSGIGDSSKRIQHIVEELKSFSRKESTDLKSPVDMNAVVNSAVDLMDNIIKKSTHNFKVSYGKDIPQMMGNFQKLEQVIINLLQNACQALDSPNKGIFISTYYDRSRRQVVVSLKDEGVGIPQKDLKYIMEPFFTTRRHSGGTGLGLSVSSRISTDHGGTLHFTSTHGKGTTVEVRFPLPPGEDRKKGRF